MTRIALILVVLTGVAHAAPNDELGMGSWIRTLHAPSANAVTGEPLSGGAFGYSRELLPELIVPRLSLWGSAAFAGGSALGTMFDMDTELDYLQFTVGARARYRLWRFIELGARVDAGSSRAALSIEDDGQAYRDHGWGGVTTSALSLDVFPYAGRAFAIGVRLEAGYTAASGIAMTPHMDRPDDGTIELPMTRASLGQLELGGTNIAFTVFARF